MAYIASPYVITDYDRAMMEARNKVALTNIAMDKKGKWETDFNEQTNYFEAEAEANGWDPDEEEDFDDGQPMTLEQPPVEQLQYYDQ